MKISDFLNEEKTRLDPACWSNKKIGTPKTKVKGGVRVNNCVPKEGVAEGHDDEDPFELSSDYALHIANAGRKMMTQLANMSKKIQTDSTAAQNANRWNLGDFMHQHYETDDLNAINQVFEEYGVGGFFDQNLSELLSNWSSQGPEYVTAWKQYSGDVIKNSTRQPSAQSVHEQGVAEGLPLASENRCMQCGMKNCKCPGNSCKCKPINGWVPGKGFKKAIDEAANAAQQAAIAIAMQKDHKKPKSESITLEQQFDMIEEMVEQLAEAHGVDAEQIWEDFESVDDHELFETAAWRRKEGKSKSGGLNAKGVASYRRENPGSKLQTAVTTKPSKLKPGSKAAKRRKSFCARMSGVDGPMKKPNGKPTRKALALRKWNC